MGTWYLVGEVLLSWCSMRFTAESLVMLLATWCCPMSPCPQHEIWSLEDCEMKFGLGKCRGTSWLANLKGHLGWTTRVEQRSCSSCYVTTLHFLSFCTYRTHAGGGNRGRGFLRVANARGGSFALWRLLLHSWWVSVSLSDFCPSRCFHYS